MDRPSDRGSEGQGFDLARSNREECRIEQFKGLCVNNQKLEANLVKRRRLHVSGNNSEFNPIALFSRTVTPFWDPSVGLRSIPLFY
jgi:hypothetical protein